MNDNETTLLISKLIDFMDENAQNIDGPYKVAALKTAASYYENITHAEGIMTLIQKSFNMIN
jgi:hypothetical protein